MRCEHTYRKLGVWFRLKFLSSSSSSSSFVASLYEWKSYSSTSKNEINFRCEALLNNVCVYTQASRRWGGGRRKSEFYYHSPSIRHVSVLWNNYYPIFNGFITIDISRIGIHFRSFCEKKILHNCSDLLMAHSQLLLLIWFSFIDLMGFFRQNTCRD